MNRRVQIYLDEELLSWLDSEAKDDGISRSEVIRMRLVDSYRNDAVYVNYVNEQLQTAQEADNE